MNLNNENNKTDNIEKIIDQYLYEENFNELINAVEEIFSLSNINLSNSHIYYERKSNKTSILAIKVTEGNNQDKENYIFFGCSAFPRTNDVDCDVYIHADAKSSKNANKFLSSSNHGSVITNFFEQLEKRLLKDKNTDLELSFILPLKIGKEKTLSKYEIKEKEDSKGIKRILKLFNKQKR